MNIEPLTPQGNTSDPDSVILTAEEISTKERDAILHAEIRDKSTQRRGEEGIPLSAVAARIESSGKTRMQITDAMVVALTTEKTEDIDINYTEAVLDDAMLTIDEEKEEEKFNEAIEELGGTVEEQATGEPTPTVEAKPGRLKNPLTLEEIFTGSSEKEAGKEDKDEELDR